MFNALVILQENEQQRVAIEQLSEEQLPEGDVTVQVSYSSINYKDGLAITGTGKIVRSFPMVPGIDFVGTVLESDSADYQPGDQVILTGWGVGERHWGGLAEKARVKSKWLVPLPANLTPEQTMIIGTAGLTAMLCVMALEHNQVDKSIGDILVTGASGGVGSTAVALLSALGYSVAAVTGRPENADYLTKLGASQIVDRSELAERAKPLDQQRWAGVIDTAGGNILANALSQTHYNGTVAACGLAADYKLPTSVMPFILRNVTLAGVDSVMCPTAKRQEAWRRLAELLPAEFYQQASEQISLAQVPQWADKIVAGKVTGRTLVKLN
ncbi:oxidoreductase [Neiella marina]|uniref:Oxidoreductase n=1 Tax=Neiella holothuriorum TaxID=2870530 RepID=A0ABS7EGH4_9GAMM|nr:MDR family oxidoreductase [Neiella holothuriorum]MBW8190901.1 oxidoreductase [Neiella holothuriorum]